VTTCFILARVIVHKRNNVRDMRLHETASLIYSLEIEIFYYDKGCNLKLYVFNFIFFSLLYVYKICFCRNEN